VPIPVVSGVQERRDRTKSASPNEGIAFFVRTIPQTGISQSEKNIVERR
jgi:hypothetical protein